MNDRILNPESIERVETPPELEAILAAFDRWDAEPSDLAAWQELAARLAQTDAPEQLQIARTALAMAVQPGRERTAAIQALLTLVNTMRPLPVQATWQDAPPPRKWLVEDRIPAGRFGTLNGDAGQGKSRLTLDLCRAISAAYSSNPPIWLTWPVRAKGAVVWASWEDENEEFARRLGTEGRADVDGGLHVVDMVELGPVWGPKVVNGRLANVAELTGVGHKLRDLCERVEARLLVIDPLAAAFGEDENDRAKVRAFCSSWDAWARRTGTTVLSIAHLPKTNASYSGSTDWLASPRYVMMMRPATDKEADEPGTKVLEWTKANYSQLPEGAYLKWDDAKGGYMNAGFKMAADRPAAAPAPVTESKTAKNGHSKTPLLDAAIREGHTQGPEFGG